MPTYDYRCTGCGREVEVVHGIHDDGPTTCESCGDALRKALSTPAIHFKGSGWAKKDARTSGTAASSSSKPTESEGKGAATGDGSVSKPGKTAEKGAADTSPSAAASSTEKAAVGSKTD